MKESTHIVRSIEDIDSVQWNDLLAASPVSTWFQSNTAYQFYMSLSEIMIPFVYGLEKNNHLKAVVVGYITKETSVLKQYFTRRAIIIGGPLLSIDISNEDTELLLNEMQKSLKNQCIYIEVRNFNDYSNWQKAFVNAGFKYVPHLNFHVNTNSKELVDGNLSKSRKRDIRVSFRDGASIVEKPSLEQIKSFYNILSQLYKKKVKLPLFPFVFFEKLYKLDSARFLLVEYNGEILGGTVCVCLKNKTMYEWFVCGMDNIYKTIFPSEVATYAGLLCAVDDNCARFDMMGAGSPNVEYGVRDFKSKFGGELVEHGRFLYVNNNLLYKLGETGVKILKKI